jgi:hypothetical protein
VCVCLCVCVCVCVCVLPRVCIPCTLTDVGTVSPRADEAARCSSASAAATHCDKADESHKSQDNHVEVFAKPSTRCGCPSQAPLQLPKPSTRCGRLSLCVCEPWQPSEAHAATTQPAVASAGVIRLAMAFGLLWHQRGQSSARAVDVPRAIKKKTRGHQNNAARIVRCACVCVYVCVCVCVWAHARACACVLSAGIEALGVASAMIGRGRRTANGRCHCPASASLRQPLPADSNKSVVGGHEHFPRLLSFALVHPHPHRVKTDMNRCLWVGSPLQPWLIVRPWS